MNLNKHSKIKEMSAGLTEAARRQAAYQKAIQQCPPIGQALIDHLELLFAPPKLRPDNPTLNNQLVYQAGIEKIKDYLKDQLKIQEGLARQQRNKP